jgi:hypothetical protein
VERLEHRTLLSIFAVNTVSDLDTASGLPAGQESLRQAIEDVNDDASPDTDTIDFNIPCSGVQMIQPLSQLPVITHPVFIDGYSQLGAIPNTLAIGDNAVLKIELDGSLAGSASAGLFISAGQSTVRGLSIHDFSWTGIECYPNGGNTIQGNFIGADTTGKKAGIGDGIYIPGGNGNLVGTNGDGIDDYAERNVIVGGVAIGGYTSTNDNVVAGNYIGTDASGTMAQGNTFWGVNISGGYNNRIGVDGHDADPSAEGNLISGNLSGGVDLFHGGQNVVAGNLIGTDVTGTKPLGNGRFDAGWVPTGVELDTSNGNRIGTDGDGVGDAAERNVISANLNIGLGLSRSNGNIVAGNFIGTDVTGTQALGNQLNGVMVGFGSSSNRIGTDGQSADNAGEGNLISGNGNDGEIVFVAGDAAPTQNNLVAGNLIGTDLNGNRPIPGALQRIIGINVEGGSNDQIGVSPALANTIMDGAGVVVNGSATGISIRANRIYGNNPGLAIDLGRDGVTLNNSHAGQPGPNNWQNFPVLSAAYAGNSSAVIGTLNSTPNTTFTVDFYANDPDKANGGGNGQGQYYLGSATVTTDGSGNVSFNMGGLAATTPGEWVSATATDPGGDTSEFSNDVQVVKASTTTALSASADPSLLNQPVTFTATVTTPITGLGNPSGSVQFLVDGSNYGSPVPLSGGVASISATGLALGAHSILVTYSGDTGFLGSSMSLTQKVQYGFSGFQAPLSTGVSYALGRTIPVKFTLTDYTGAAVTSLAAVTGLQIVPLNPNGAAFNPVSTDGKGLNVNGGQYLFNWKTTGLAAGSYQIVLNLADGTTQTKTIQLKAGGGAAGLLADTTGTSTAATAGALLGGDLTIAVNDPNGLLTADELSRISDAISLIDLTVAPYGVTMTQIDPSSGLADVTIDTNSTSAVGGFADGVLGCESGTEITLIQGWNWYAGADPATVQAGQFDFETVAMHELGHVLGLGHSADPTSVMYATLAAGTANRNLTVADLNVTDADGGSPAGLHARVPRPAPTPWTATDPTAPTLTQNVGLIAWDAALADLFPTDPSHSQRKRT